MHLFVFEYISSGAWAGDDLPESLAEEGLSMLRAFLTDAAALPGVTVSTSCTRRLDPGVAGVRVLPVDHPAHERNVFAELVSQCDATFLIAPEFDGLLAERCRIVESLGKRLIGPSSAAVELCTDKWELARQLTAAGVSTLETLLLDLTQVLPRDLPFPIVVKPRDGAGSQSTFLLHGDPELAALQERLPVEPMLRNAIWQPYVSGLPCSVAVLCHDYGAFTPLLPSEQTLSTDGRFHYLGGVIPARAANLDRLQHAACRAVKQVPGLRGYAGVDLILTDADEPVVVEINPRLTTSYLGLRELAEDNLAERILFPAGPEKPIRWRSGKRTFTASGCHPSID